MVRRAAAGAGAAFLRLRVASGAASKWCFSAISSVGDAAVKDTLGSFSPDEDEGITAGKGVDELIKSKVGIQAGSEARTVTVPEPTQSATADCWHCRDDDAVDERAFSMYCEISSGQRNEVNPRTLSYTQRLTTSL
jgi:hypothetical protein